MGGRSPERRIAQAALGTDRFRARVLRSERIRRSALQDDGFLRAGVRALYPLERSGTPYRLAPLGRAHAVCQRCRGRAAPGCRSVSVKILLTGRNGQLGWELARALAPLGEVGALDRQELDLAVPDQIASAVDRAESEPDAAHAINATAVGILAEEAKRAGALLIHYSTDYVFDGIKDAPYVEADPPNPLNAYGRSKLAGELAIRNVDGSHLILRTSWVYATRGRNFFLTMRRLLKERDEVRVVSDQIGAPTSAQALADTTAELLGRHGAAALGDAGGVYHATAGGYTSWHGFATEIARLERSDFT